MNSCLQRKEITNVRVFDASPAENDDLDEILAGLRQHQKRINPRFLYDTRGSELFERITITPEYYPTRTERKLLSAFADEIAASCGENFVLIEPGSGSSEKVRLLFQAMQPSTYVPIDIAGDFLTRTAFKLGNEYPDIDIQALCADFSAVDLDALDLPDHRRIVFYPGSTIGNMTPGQAAGFLQQLHAWVGADGAVILGVDLHKDRDILNAAYNDREGITAAFNLNCLKNINQLVDADFNTARFSHRAFYNEPLKRIEMHLDCHADHVVWLSGHRVEFARGESIHTENSYKYTDESVRSLAEAAGFALTTSWHDERHYFGVYFLQA
jgi:dimethylhistidine N-methyltransferase